VSRLGADGKWRYYTSGSGQGPLPSDDVNAIVADGATGDTWFGTGDWFGFGTAGGATRLDAEGHWQTFTTADGLVDNHVRVIEIDAATRDVWFGTVGGASRLSADGRWQTFTAADGLLSSYINDIAIEAATGDTWFAVETGVTQLTHPANTGSCDDAVPVAPGPQAVAELAGSDDIALYRLEVTEPFTRLDVTLSDPDDQIAAELLRACDGPAGPGTGRHIGPGTGATSVRSSASPATSPSRPAPTTCPSPPREASPPSPCDTASKSASPRWSGRRSAVSS
jgi:hypothetical protein